MIIVENQSYETKKENEPTTKEVSATSLQPPSQRK